MGNNEGLNTVTGQLAKRVTCSPIALEIRNQALEDAALLCEALANKKKVDAANYDNGGDKRTGTICTAQASSMFACAIAIRNEKLKG